MVIAELAAAKAKSSSSSLESRRRCRPHGRHHAIDVTCTVVVVVRRITAAAVVSDLCVGSQAPIVRSLEADSEESKCECRKRYRKGVYSSSRNISR